MLNFYQTVQKAAKYDRDLDRKAREWLEELTGEAFPTGLEPDMNSFHEALKDGTYLCRAINVLQPGSVPKINQSKMAFKMVSFHKCTVGLILIIMLHSLVQTLHLFYCETSLM